MRIKRNKLQRVDEADEKKAAYVLTLILPQGHFCSICISSQCIEYWINFHTLFCLFLKSQKAFSASLKQTKSDKK